MGRMRSSGSRLRNIASFSAAAFAVHELRYLFAFGGDAGEVLVSQGHAYLQIVCALVGLLVVCAAVQLLALTAGRDRLTPGDPRGVRGRWASASVALVVIFALQEFVEGSLAAGHPAGVMGVFGGGGWLAIPLAVVFGLIVAVVLREAEAVLDAKPLRVSRPVVVAAVAGLVARVSVLRWRSALLAEHLVGRGPPLRVV